MDEKMFIKVDEEQKLLNTIRVPQNLHFLTDQLPKANYNELKLIKIDKHIFFQSQEDHSGRLLPMIKGGTSSQGLGYSLAEAHLQKQRLQLEDNQVPHITRK